ncbi:unnamed protein product, partial [Amoebophrya sp. A25]
RKGESRLDNLPTSRTGIHFICKQPPKHLGKFARLCFSLGDLYHPDGLLLLLLHCLHNKNLNFRVLESLLAAISSCMNERTNNIHN